MAIENYSDLKTAIANWLARDDLTSQIPDFITFGEKRIYRDLRIRAMEASLSDTIASGVISVPSDYVELKHAYVTGSPYQPLERRNAEDIYNMYPIRSADGKPSYIAREGSNFIFGPYPDSNYTVDGIYYKRLTALSTSNETNWFTSNAPDLLLYASLLAAEPYIQNDERLMVWKSLYGEIKDDIRDEDNRENYSGSILMTRAG